MVLKTAFIDLFVKAHDVSPELTLKQNVLAICISRGLNITVMSNLVMYHKQYFI